MIPVWKWRWRFCIGAMLLATAGAAAAPAATLLHRYTLGNGNANDSIGKLNGHIVGFPEFVAGRVGPGALFFSGVRDALVLDEMDIGPKFTISLWVKPAYDGDYTMQPIFSTSLNGGAGETDSGRFFLALNDRGTQDSRVILKTYEDTGPRIPCTDAGALPPGGWSLLTIVVDTTATPPETQPSKRQIGTCLTYIDGKQVAIQRSIVRVLRQHTGFTFGALPGYPTHFRGTIDDVRIYQGTLTPEEIQALADAPHGTDPRGDSPTVTVPAVDQVLKTLKAGHPRVMLTPDRLAALKAGIKTDKNLQAWFALLRDSSDQLLAKGVPSDPKARKLLVYQHWDRQSAEELALMYRLTGDRKYLDGLWQILSTAAKIPFWDDKAWGLAAGEECVAFAVGYDWCYDAWTDAQKDVLRAAMKHNALQAALDVYTDKAPGGWYRVTFNWNQVCNGGAMLAALAMADDEPAMSARVLRYGLISLPRAMAQFGPDGACPEAPNYWDYANLFSTMVCASLQDSLGTDFGLTNIEGYNHVGDEPLYNVGPLDREFNYGDSPADNVLAPEMFWLADRFDRPQWAQYEVPHVAPAPINHPDLPLAMIWYDPSMVARPTPDLPLDKYFRRTELVDLRSAWNNPDAAFFAFKGGFNGANHSHLNGGSFVFDANGMRWAWLDTAEKYSAPGYFDFHKQRWTYYRTRPEGGNTLVIDPGEDPGQTLDAVMPVVKFVDDKQSPWAIIDLTDAYRDQADKVLRGYKFIDRRDALIEDEIKTKSPADVWWFMHAAKAISLDPTGRMAILSKQGKACAVRLLSPADARFQVMDAVPLPTSPKVANTPEIGVKKLAIHLQGVSETRIAVELIPLITPSAAAPGGADVEPLANW